ncbi:MAG TPA: sensor histidine kinase [Streptosporangiaceae bacterium]|nr:sensor histidine kinase [Streptosporangiaceae bacterium]
MQAVRCLHDPDLVNDAGIAIAGAVLTAVAAWDPAGLAGPKVVGPPWLLVLLPLLMGAALVFRRRTPLVMWIGIWAGITLQNLITRHPPQGLEFFFVLLAGGYALGAHASLRRGAAGLAVTALVMALISRLGGVGMGLAPLPVLVFWLAGVFVRVRRRTAELAERNAALQRQAEQAAEAERTRIARELHDIVAHHLSVIVLQAAGTRASGKDPDAALEKIETSGRQALAETRRLLGVLRGSGAEAGLGPQPGIGELAALTASVREAGLPVSLAISGDRTLLPAAVDVSVYRIVQEALTNVLKHAGRSRANVTIGCADSAVTIEVTDDGTTDSRDQVPAGGLGLAGMRERAAIFGGELHAGPRPGGGFAVHARLPLDDHLSPGPGVPPDDRLWPNDRVQQAYRVPQGGGRS